MSYEYIYILQLDHGKFYVGRSSNPEQALFDHKYDKNDCEWTKLYKPIGEGGFLMAPYVGDEMDVEQITHQLMTQYGYENVRNSTRYQAKDLSKDEIKELKEALGITKDYRMDGIRKIESDLLRSTKVFSSIFMMPLKHAIVVAECAINIKFARFIVTF